MRKKILSVMLMLIACILAAQIAALPMTASAETNGTCGNNLTWTLDSTGTLTISGTGGMGNYFEDDDTVGAPWQSLRSDIKSVNIKNGVTSIGSYAFYHCSQLTSVTIPDSVTSIGEYAFYGCERLTSITIPDGVTRTGDYAFAWCTGLTSVTIPGSVTDNMGSYMFYNCEGLTSVTILEGVSFINYAMFWDCENLTSVTIPSSMKGIGGAVFYGCDSLTDVYYNGSQSDWEAVGIASNNTPLTDANIHYLYGAITYDKESRIVTINSDQACANARVLIAAYSGTGLSSVKSQPKNLVIGENTVSFSDFDASVADQVKIFVWESTSGIKPLFDVYID